MAMIPRILIIDDDEDDYYLTADLLCEAYGLASIPDWVDTWDKGLTAIVAGGYDAYVVDYRLGARDGLELVREAVSQGCNAPIILLTSQDSNDIDHEAMGAGATDYLIKGKTTADQISRAIRYGINQKKIEGRLASMALEDTLTGLPNRALFETRLEDAIAQAARGERVVAVMLLDLDHFKGVNDTLGHPVGDLLLKEVSQRLLVAARETDTVARLSGDEFAIIATSLHNESGATRLAARIVEEIARPFNLDGKEVCTGVSIGITMPGKEETEPAKILSNADLALYQSKDNGGSSFCFFDRAMNAREQAARRMEIELRAALERDEFAVRFQPLVGVSSGEIIGVESLLRWEHPRDGLISPPEFLPVAESTGLIVPLSDWILHEVCAQIGTWAAAGLPQMPTAVRIYKQQLQRGQLCKTVARAINDTGISPELLDLEISEADLLQNVEAVSEIIRQLHDIGVRVSLRNFGAGLMSLNALVNLPVQRAKLDANLLKDVENEAIVKSVVGLGRNLNLTVAADNMQSDADLTRVRQYGCHEAQGEIVSKPLTGDDFARWYQQNSNKLAASA